MPIPSWQPADNDLKRLRGDGGGPFTVFVDALLRAEATFRGVSQLEVSTNVRTNLPDGGVDSEVRQNLGEDHPGPTVWQYKATDQSSLSESALRRELVKPYARERISQGAAYRLCLCESITPEAKAEAEELLQRLIGEIKADAPLARVLSVSELAAWVSDFPALVMRFFHPHLGQGALTFEAWRKGQAALAPKFVSIAAHERARNVVASHGRLSEPTESPVLVVRGSWGAGKTRLVHESLIGDPNLVLYCTEANAALQLVGALLNEQRGNALIVVDDCTTKIAAKLMQVLAGAGDRVRCIAILESGESWSGSSVDIPVMDDAAVEGILKENFPQLAWQHRTAIARLASGVPRIAIGIGKRGSPNPVASSVLEANDTIDALVPDDADRAALECLSFLGRVGFRGAVKEELALLAGAMGLQAGDVMTRARRLAKSCGLVAVGQRYVHLCPPLFCGAFLARAWTRWTGIAPDRFPKELISRFLERVGEHGSDIIRSEVSDWGARWLQDLDLDVSDAAHMAVVVPLLEIDPRRFLPRLSAALEQMDATSMTRLQKGSCESPRSDLIHVLEGLASHASYYRLAESVLFRIALADPKSATRSGGRAGEIWSQSFRVLLSGTAAPFAERFDILRKRQSEDAPGSLPLVVSAIRRGLDWSPTRTVGMVTIGGLLRPLDWRPASNTEHRRCTVCFIEALGRLLSRSDAREYVTEILSTRVRALLHRGFLPELEQTLHADALDEDMRVAVLSAVNNFLYYDCGGEAQSPEINDYIGKVSDWKTQFERKDFRGRLATFVGANPISDRLENDSAWRDELNSFARELYGLPEDERRAQLSWLTAGKTFSGGQYELGEHLGLLDADGGMAAQIFSEASTAANPLFIRGYATGLCAARAGERDLVRRYLDQLERTAPEVAFDLAVTVLPADEVVNRAEGLIQAGKLSLRALRDVRKASRDPVALARLVRLLLGVAEQQREDGIDIALDLLGFLAIPSLRGSLLDVLEVREVAWSALEKGLLGVGAESYWWGKLLDLFTELDVERGLPIACEGMLSDDYSIREEARKILLRTIPEEPERVLKVFGPLLLTERADSFNFDRKKGLILAFPEHLLGEWIEQVGVSAARAIASHLPEPFVDGYGQAVVPPLTALVLERFEDDEVVYERFVHGIDSGRVYVGDIARQHDEAAAVAKLFADHPLRRVREWAEIARTSKAQEAQFWRELDEDRRWG